MTGIIIAVLILCLVDLAALRFFIPWYVNRRIGRLQNGLVDRHYDEVETMYRRMRGWRHDYHNHIQVLKVYMKNQNYEKAEAYLDALAEDLTMVDTMLKTGNVMADAILNSKLALLREKEIAVDATAIVPRDVNISDVDMAVLIGNLLDNAMEACMQIKEKEKRFVRIYIDIIKKQLYISVTNSMNGRAAKSGSRYKTAKAGEHGFGLMRTDSIVAKYHGYINRQNEDGVFATEVMLPLSDQ